MRNKGLKTDEIDPGGGGGRENLMVKINVEYALSDFM